MSTDGRTAIILSGGGMRSAHGAGFLYALATELGITTPDIIVGTSGDAGNALYYATGQYESARRIWLEHLPHSRFLNPWRFWKMMDVDYLIDYVFKQQEPLDLKRLASTPIDWMIPITDYDTGRARYVTRADGFDPYEVLRAAKAVPFFFGKLVSIRGQRYIDGEVGPTLHEHIETTLARGATRILVINHGSPNSAVMRYLKKAYGTTLPSGLREAMRRDQATPSTCMIGPEGTQILCLFPNTLPGKFATHDEAGIRAMFASGVADALSLAPELRDLLG